MIKMILVLASLCATTGLQAQTVDQRHSRQQARIATGVASGRLTAAEAAHDERQQARIQRDETRMRGNNGGYLTPAQRARLQYRENRASNHIYRTKHN
jgi:hypothetical protein